MIELIKPAFAQNMPQVRTNLANEYAFGDIKSLGDGLSHLAGPMFYLAATAVTFYMVIGAFKFITSGGDKNALQGAKNMITHSIIGFVLLIMLVVPYILPLAISFPALLMTYPANFDNLILYLIYPLLVVLTQPV